MFQSQWRVLHYGIKSDTSLEWKQTIAACCILPNAAITVDKKGRKMAGSLNNGAVLNEKGALKHKDPHEADNTDPRPGAPDAPRAKIQRDHLVQMPESRR